MSTPGKVYKRKKFFNFSIKRKLQWRILLKIWGIILVSLLITSIIFYFYSDINVGKSYRSFHVKATNFLDFLIPVLLTGFLASLILGVVASLFFPHPIAGPLYRIERELVDIGKGNLRSKMDIRKGDELGDLADAINVMIRGLRDNIKAISDISMEIEALVASAKGEEPAETIKKIKAANANLQETIKKFKL
ncbi:MAG: methyl-accepting chemotaxis protein [Deltaproteobacteria bacterium]|nr:methyl-accepting chemotaxis protein [Deltaproteobacteria bacterium]MBW2074891.1 methyl-accepting chemotaxis protein [Deltaproteobacteria bacterium]RLB82100.1 MAG: hypothetical protein DRH17_07060 [Deltaproteobacteria bacterium]